jgi:hypothetical protein
VSYKSRETAAPPVLVLSLRSASVPDAAPALAITAPADGTLVRPGSPVTLAATASDREEGDLTAQIAWSSDLTGPLGTGSPLGVVLPAGTHRVRAEVADGLGQSAAAEVAVIVNTPPVVTISQPADGTVIGEGTPLTLAAGASDLEDGDLSGALTWISNRDGLLGGGPSLVADALSPGPHTLTATVADALGTTGSASITVVVRASVITAAPVADTYVAADNPTASFGTAKTLRADASPECLLFLRFAVNGLGALPPDRAIVRLTVSGASGSSSISGGTLHGLSDTGWQESALTYADRPAVDGPAYGAASAVKSGQLVEFDVTGAIAGDGAYAFAVVTSSSDAVGYLSRESGSGAPQLILITEGLPSDPPTVTITAPADGTAVALGAPVTLSGVASDPEEGDLSRAIVWSSDRDGVLGQGASLSVSRLSIGTHVIAAKVTDASGATAMASTSLRVTGGVLTLVATEDATVKADAPDSNYGGSSALAADGSPTRRFYLRFQVPDLAGLTITQATLRLTVRSGLGSGGPSGGDVHRVDGTAWSESTVTFATSPPVTGPILASAGPVVEGQVVDLDLTGAVAADQANDFVVDTTSDNKVEYSSHEDGEDGPRLVLVVE